MTGARAMPIHSRASRWPELSRWRFRQSRKRPSAKPQAAREGKPQSYAVECRNQDGELLISGTAEAPANG